MRKKLKQNLALIVIGIIGFAPNLHSQSIYKINNSKDINMKLSGTSTLHKWAMNAKTFTGEAQFGFTAGNQLQLTSLKSLTFSLLVYKSEKR